MPDLIRRRWTGVLGVLGLLTAAATPLSAQVPSVSDDSVRSILETRIARHGAVGLAVGRLIAGERWVLSAGRRAGVGSAGVDAGTLFEIGSVAKVLTATLLAEMVIRGEVALEDPVQRYLPDTVRMPTRNGREITLLDLATHTSGLPRLPDNLAPATVENPYADYHMPDLYAFLNGYTLIRDPGAQYEYSNLGMGLLGHLLARHAGQSYEALVTERILLPLGMIDTRITVPAEHRQRVAWGHDAALEAAAPWEFGVLAAAGAWHSTPADLLRLLVAAANPPEHPVGRALRLATAPQRPTTIPGTEIGLAWHRSTQGQRQVVWHNGQTGGFHAFVGFDPSTGVGAVVLANSATDVDDIGFHLVEPGNAIRHPSPPRPAMPVDSLTLERYVGEYQLAPAVLVTVTREADRLYAQLTGQERFPIFGASPIRFFWRVVDAEIEFHTDTAGVVTAATLYQAGQEVTARRIGR